MRSVKLIAVSDPNGMIGSILKKIMDLCGRTNCRVAPAGEPLRPEEVPYLLLAGTGEFADAAGKFQKYVAPYENQKGSPGPNQCFVTYSMEDDRADYTVKNIRRSPDGQMTFEIVGAGVIGRVKRNSGQAEFVEQALAAAAAAMTAGISFAEVLDALNTMPLQAESVVPT
ncbi:hypothetical protein [Caproiciproducens sp. LBM24188]|nr:hypothetical protein [Clostridiales bacterium]